MDPKVIMMAALGRPLYPGMLYDCRKDSFIPGVTLWDKNALNSDLDVHDQTKTYVNLAASDDVSNKANLLDVSASLKASFLGGLVEVGGSAKYLNDSKSSAQQCRVTMQFSQTTKFEQLTMKELGNVTYPQVFEQKTATHVVTAVLYGASAFMVFDYTTSGNESIQAIEGSLQAVVKKIPTISIEGQASLKMTQEEKTLAENINVTFYGDYELDENPTTYTDALRVCKKLPSALKDRNSKGVPVTVWLYPLILLDNRAAKLMKEITLNLVCKTESLLEDLGEVERRCNDLVNNKTTNDFPDLRERLLRFRDLHSYYKITFQKALVTVLPGIRSGSLENQALGDILNKHYTSPFTVTNMNTWLDNISSELYILNSYTSGLSDLPMVTSSGTLNTMLFDPIVNVVVCLSFTSLKGQDSYLAALQDFVNTSTNVGQKNLFSTQPWFTSCDISDRMRQNLSLFTSFSKANKNDSTIKFIVASISDPSNPGTSIRLYQNGTLTDAKFLPLSKPPLPIVDASYEKVNLNLFPSPTGKTDKFRVEYTRTTPTDSAADASQWIVIDTPDAQSSFSLTDLKPADQYWVRYRAVSNMGVSEPCDYVPFNFQAKIDLSVAQWDLSMTSLYNALRNKIMTSLGMSRWGLSTIKPEVQNFYNNINIPFTGSIVAAVKPGMAFYFQGVVSATAGFFEIDLTAGTKEAGGDLIFHMFFSITDNYLSYNTCKNRNWDSVIRVPGCPLPKGSAFDVFFVVKTEGYEVYINGQKQYLFNHRLPMERANTVQIYGDVIMNMCGNIQNWSTSTFGKELISGVSRDRLSNIQYDVPRPICNPRGTYAAKIPGNMRPGVALFFQGVLASNGSGFRINLMTSPQIGYDIALHFNPRISYVTLNNCVNGNWGDQVDVFGSPLISGGAFDLFIIANTKCFETVVNGLPFCTFNHRLPVEKVKFIDISGDVFLNKFGVIEVGGLIMQSIIPANI